MSKERKEISNSITNDISNQFKSWLLYQRVINEINSNPEYSGIKELINGNCKASIKSKAIQKHIEQNYLKEWFIIDEQNKPI